MMNNIILNGLKVSTPSKFIKFEIGNNFSIIDDVTTNTCTVTYIKDTRAGDIIDSRAICIDPEVNLRPTDWVRICNPLLDIEGLIVRSIAPYEYQIKQYIVDGIEKFYTDYNEGMCIILVPRQSVKDIQSYQKTIGSIPYLQIVSTSPKFVEIHNIYGVELYRSNIRLANLNSTVYNPKENYDRFLIRDVDYLAGLIHKLGSILNQYGVTLVRYPIDKNTDRTDRIIYKITEYQAQDIYRSNYGVLMGLTRHRTNIEFEVSFLNQIKLEDFKTRYQDMRLITDFTTFNVTDKLGRSWKASLKWNPINTDWNPDYNVDNQGNAGYSATFSVELRYYVVYDMVFNNIIDQIQLTLGASNTDGSDEVAEQTLDPEEVTPVDNKDAHQAAIEELDEWEKLRSI